VSVPIRLQHRLLGEFDLFFRAPVTLSTEETELLDALASHLASALEGLRAEALEREAAVGEERALLARELHDSIAQSLAFMKIQVQLLRNAAQRGQPDKLNSILDELDAGVRESINDVRELLVHFRTRTNTENIEQALQETLQKFEHQTGLPARLEVHGDGLPLPADVQVQVLHVVQEGAVECAQARRCLPCVAGGAKGPALALRGARQWRRLQRQPGSRRVACGPEDHARACRPHRRRGRNHLGAGCRHHRDADPAAASGGDRPDRQPRAPARCDDDHCSDILKISC
jgi:two-component system nitrate/nitrite sensor histidine kinase NarX